MTVTKKTIADTIASYGASLRYEDIPPETVHKAKGLLIDSIGCALGGYASEPAKIARTIAGGVTLRADAHFTRDEAIRDKLFKQI